MVNKRFWLVGLLTLMIALAFATVTAQAAEPDKSDGVVSDNLSDAPPDPQWELMLEMRRAEMDRKLAQWDAFVASHPGISNKKFEMVMVDFFRSRGFRIRNGDRYFDRRDNLCRNYNGSAYFGISKPQCQGQGTQAGQGTTQGQAQATQQGQTQGTQQGQGQGTQQGQGQGTQQGQGNQQGQYGGLSWREDWDPTRVRMPLRAGRCNELMAAGNAALQGFATRNGATYSDVSSRLCAGARMSDLKLGYWVSRKAGITADAVFSQRASGMSWQDILTAYDLRYDVRTPEVTR